LIDHTQISAWVGWKTRLTLAKTQEMKLRLEICQSMFGRKRGAFRVKESDDGYSVTAISKLKTKLDAEGLTFIWNDLTEDEKACVIYKPTLVSSALKNLGEDSALWSVITTEPATPALEVSEA